MACDLSAGITLVDCNESVGGIKTIWVANSHDVINDASSVIANTSLTANTSTLTFYEVQVHPEKASLNVRINASPENGTSFYDQELEVVVRDLRASNQKSIEDFIKASMLVAVQLYSGDYLLLGAEHGCDATGGQLESGRGFGDMQGYTLNLRGRETSNIVVNIDSSDWPASWTQS